MTEDKERETLRRIDNLKEKILKEYPRLDRSDSFKFNCHPGIDCFNTCCADINILLTPYDILRMKRRLGISSGEFLERYTLSPFNKQQTLPVIVLRMNDDDRRTCPFVSEQGCTIYEDRPWSCRMYPVGYASPTELAMETKPFYFLMDDKECRGLSENKQWTIEGWIKDQGIDKYDEFGELFKGVNYHPRLSMGMKLAPQQLHMYHTVCYDLDSFRRFIIESTFLERFIVADEVIDTIKQDDEELLKFGFEWLKFSLFHEKTPLIKKRYLDENIKRKK